jgi:hypothetical protein
VIDIPSLLGLRTDLRPQNPNETPSFRKERTMPEKKDCPGAKDIDDDAEDAKDHIKNVRDDRNLAENLKDELDLALKHLEEITQDNHKPR